MSKATHVLKDNRGFALEDVRKERVERRGGGEPQKTWEEAPWGNPRQTYLDVGVEKNWEILCHAVRGSAAHKAQSHRLFRL